MRAVLGSFAPKSFVLTILALGWLFTAAWAQGDSAAMERVLTQMDTAARNFKSAEANVVQDQYDRVINETDTEKGKIYFRREGGEVQMAADFLEPDKKDVIYSGGVGSLEDLEALASLRHPRLAGVIAGKALYEGRFTVAEGQEALCSFAV